MPDRSTILRYYALLRDLGCTPPALSNEIFHPTDRYETTDLTFVLETLKPGSQRDIGAFYISFLPDTTELKAMVIANMYQWFDARSPSFSKCEKLFTTLRGKGISAEAFFTERDK